MKTPFGTVPGMTYQDHRPRGDDEGDGHYRG